MKKFKPSKIAILTLGLLLISCGTKQDSESTSSIDTSFTSSSSSSHTSESVEESSFSTTEEPSKEELIQGYSLHFSDPKLTKVGEAADDIYLKAEVLPSSILISMVGFGDFMANEYVKLIFHTSSNNGTSWKIQSDDVSFLVSKEKAYYRTSLTKFWDYVNFGQDKEANHLPDYHGFNTYFTITFEVDFTEIPSYQSHGMLSLYAMEFSSGSIYDGIDYRNGMLIDGLSHGDPADQSSYFVIQEKSLDEEQRKQIADYPYQFSIGSDNIFGKITRKKTSLLLDLLSFESFDDTDFIRFIVKTNENYKTSWGLDEEDVSFTIDKIRSYYQTGKTSFYENSENQFHGQALTLHLPQYQKKETHWTLSLEIEYSELSLTNDINSQTVLRGILVEYTPELANNGFKENGRTILSISDQNQYFAF